MALFFDAAWFDQRLRVLGLGRASIAATLNLSETALDELYKDQRELKPTEVVTLAALLAVPAAEVARRAGIGTVVEDVPATPFDERLDAVEQAMARLEERMSRIEDLIARAVDGTRAIRADIAAGGGD